MTSAIINSNANELSLHQGRRKQILDGQAMAVDNIIVVWSGGDKRAKRARQGGLGATPRKFLAFTPSEIVSDAILG